MVIVEGPDGGGKTTMVNRLCEKFGTDIEARPCTSDNAVDPHTLKEWVLADLSRPVAEHGLYDRYPLFSEPIYGPLIRGRMADGFNDPGWLAEAIRMLMVINPVIVYCLPPKNEVLENIERNHEATTDHLRGVLRQSEALYELYAAQLGFISPLFYVFPWDYTRHGEAEFQNICITISRRRAL